jgi:hypothetical protein
MERELRAICCNAKEVWVGGAALGSAVVGAFVIGAVVAGTPEIGGKIGADSGGPVIGTGVVGAAVGSDVLGAAVVGTVAGGVKEVPLLAADGCRTTSTTTTTTAPARLNKIPPNKIHRHWYQYCPDVFGFGNHDRFLLISIRYPLGFHSIRTALRCHMTAVVRTGSTVRVVRCPGGSVYSPTRKRK